MNTPLLPAPVTEAAADQLNPGDLEQINFVPGMAGPDEVLFWSPSLKACFKALLGQDPDGRDSSLQGPLDALAVAKVWNEYQVGYFLSEAYYGPTSMFQNPYVLLQSEKHELAALFEQHTGSTIAQGQPFPYEEAA